MLKSIKETINNLIQSFDNDKHGFSGRKLTAFWFVMVTTYLEYKFVDFTNIVEVVSINLLLVLLLLGVVTFEQIIKFKSGSDGAKKTDKNSDTNSNNTDPNNSV